MQDTVETPMPVVGVLHPGELGSRLGEVPASAGRRVVATLEGRGPRTRQLCREAGLEVAGSFAAWPALPTWSCLVVPPSAAVAVAEQYAAATCGSGRPRLYVDVNSVSPESAARVGEIVAGAAEFVDAAVLGLGVAAARAGRVFLSGWGAGASPTCSPGWCGCASSATPPDRRWP